MEVKILNDRNIPTGIEFYSRYLRSDLLYRNLYLAAACQRFADNKTDLAIVGQQYSELLCLMALFSKQEWASLYALHYRVHKLLSEPAADQVKKRSAN